jgi:tRNA A37 threonylcarbamoyltransferase TsaD
MRPGVRTEDVAASFQAAVVDTLVTKAAVACALYDTPRIAIGGGVACNGPLREALVAKGKEQGFEVFLTPPKLCTDNAAMVASQGYSGFSNAGPTRCPSRCVRVRCGRARKRLPRPSLTVKVPPGRRVVPPGPKAQVA